MSARCNRCDYRTDGDLAEHALEAEHPLCMVCQTRSLTEHEPQTCAACVARVRTQLAELIDAYALLHPSTLDSLVLLGDGTMQRIPHAYELSTWTLPLRDQIRDEWQADPLPIIATLASWEDFWRADYHDPAAGKPTLSGVVDYLTRNLDTGHRAAQTHHAFDEFAAGVRRLRAIAQHHAGLADVPVEAPASCFDCGEPLLRTFRDLRIPVVRRLEQGRAWIAQDDALFAKAVLAQAAARKAGVRPEPLPDVPSRAERMTQALSGRDDEGLDDQWTCSGCGAEYDTETYLLAARGLRDECQGWVPLTLAAQTAHKPVRTVRSWVERSLVSAACRLPDRTVLVWWPEVADRSFVRDVPHEEAS